MICYSCSSDVYSVSVGRWTDNETGKILRTCYFNKKYFWGTITTAFWSFDKYYIWINRINWSNSKTWKLLLVLFLCFFLLNYADMKCSARRQSTVWQIVVQSNFWFVAIASRIKIAKALSIKHLAVSIRSLVNVDMQNIYSFQRQ